MANTACVEAKVFSGWCSKHNCAIELEGWCDPDSTVITIQGKEVTFDEGFTCPEYDKGYAQLEKGEITEAEFTEKYECGATWELLVAGQIVS